MHWRLFLLLLMGQCSLFLCQHYEYHFIKEPKTWDEAQSYCRENYTDLATVPNRKYMERLYRNPTANPDKAWIGLYSISGKEKRTWHWSLPGVEFHDEEMRWNLGEPNDAAGHLENCARTESSGRLKDVGCSNRHNFICYSEQNKSLHFIDTPKLWREAQRHCRKHHTDLASGVKQLNESVSTFSNKLQESWIGLFRDTWRWSDGSNSSYRLWQSVDELPEETSQTSNGTRKCAMTALKKPGKWSSDHCNNRKPFFCYNGTGNNTIPPEPTPSESAILCPDMTDQFILINESKKWDEALYYCREHHHDLVSITNPEEQELVEEKAMNANTSHVWLGLHYSCVLDLWFWVSDQLFKYENWANETVTDQCDLSVAMETGGENKWFKKNDEEEFNFICSLW